MMRWIGIVLAVLLFPASCGDDTSTSSTAEFCRLDKRVSAVRWAIYGPPLREGHGEIVSSPLGP